MNPTRKNSILRSAIALLALAFVFLLPSTDAASAGAGEIAIYTETTGTDAITTADFTHDFDSPAVREDSGSFTLGSGTNITLNRSGHYLAIYNSQFESASTADARSEVQSHLTLDSVTPGTTPLPVGWSQGYIRRTQGTSSQIAITSGAAVFEATAGDVLQLHSFRTDTATQGVTRSASATGLQLVKLDDDNMDFAKLSLTTGVAGPTTATFLKVPYDTATFGSGFTHDAAGELKLVEGGKYLVVANTYIDGPNNRTGLIQRLDLDDVAIDGSKTTAYLRGSGSQSCEDGAASIAAIIEAAPNQVLKVKGGLDVNNTTNYVGNRCGLTVVKIPDTSEYVRVSNTTDQNVNPAADIALTFANNIEVDSLSFAHTAAGSEVTVKQAGDYLFLSTIYDPTDQVARGYYGQAWSVQGAAREFYGHSGRFTRATSGGINEFGNTSGFLGDTLSVDDTVEVVSKALAEAGINNANRIFLQGVRIASLLGGVDVSPQSVAVTEGAAAGTYSVGLQIDPAAAVDITVTSDADTEVSTNGTNFFASVVLSLTDTTPQTVHVRALENGDMEGTVTATITHAVTTTGDAFGYPLTLSIDDVSVDITDNDITPVVAADDASTTNADEDTATDEAIIAPQLTLIANDTDGFNNFVSAYDSTSANGAAVTVVSDGTFDYDPTAAAALQALDDGGSVVDTFDYTVEDANGNTDVGTVSITVDGVNDAPVLTADTADSYNLAGASLNVLSNDSEVDTGDVMTVTNITTGGAVPTTIFDGAYVPLEFTSAQGATVTITADGAFSYDPTTFTAIRALAAADSPIVEVFTYDVSDGDLTVQTTVTVTNIGADLPTDDYATVTVGSTVNISALANDLVRNTASVGTATAGAELAFVAQDDRAGTNSDTIWYEVGAAFVVSIPDPGPGTLDATLNASLTNPPVGLTKAYSFAAGTGIPMDGIDVAAYGQSDLVDASIEMVFRPSDQTGDEVLWEGGGATDGSSLVLLGDQVVWTSGDNGREIAQVIGQLPAGAMSGGEFVHVIAQIDLTNDFARLYLNGVPVDTSFAVDVNDGGPGNLADWCGDDDGGLGVLGGNEIGATAGNLGNHGTVDVDSAGAFSGEIAILRTYESILTVTEVTANFDAIFGSSAAAVTADITDLAGGGVPVLDTAIPLGNGATVTLRTGDIFEYYPGTAFDDLAVDFTATDTFTYTLNTEPSDTIVTVTVQVTGTNTDPQITIAADQPGGVTEGTNATFTVSASGAGASNVTVDLSYSGTAGDGTDFTGTAQMPPFSGTSDTLTLPTIVDNVFEGVIENIVVTITGVSGSHVLGSPVAAETFITDGTAAPDFSIAKDGASYAEGANAEFTITATEGYEQDITVDLSYSGSTTADADFLSQASVILPASTYPTVNTTIDLDLVLLEDGIVDPETLTVTIDSVSLGTIGTASDSTNVTDGDGVLIFDADFEAVTVDEANPDPDTTGANAPAAANTGTAVGSWEDIYIASSAGDVPGVYVESDDDIDRGDGIDNALVLDRPGVGFGDVTAKFDRPMDLSGSNTGVISFDAAVRRTQGNSQAKDIYFTGLDASGVKSFEFFIDTNNNAATFGQIISLDSGMTPTPVGTQNDLPNQGQDEAETDCTNVKLVLDSSGYTVSIDTDLDGVYETTSGTLAYAGAATQISEVLVSIPGSADTGISGGIMLDEVKAAGIAGNQPPSLSLDGSELADAGSTGLPNQSTSVAVVFDSANSRQLQIADPDAASGLVTLRLQAVNSLGTIDILLLGGSATISAGADDSFDVTLEGTVADINATLANGIEYDAGAVGGAAILRLTADDDGNTGVPPGALTATHDITFTLAAEPLVTIDQAAGQADPGLTSPVVFDVIFSETVEGFDNGATDVVLSGTAGATTAGIAGSGATYTVSVSGMTQTGTVIATIPADAAQRPSTVIGNLASTSTDNTVTYVLNVPPTATNLSQVFTPATAGVGEMVDLDDILTGDGNNLFESTISTLGNPLFTYDGGTNVTTFDGGSPADDDATFTLPATTRANGFSLDIAFTPTAADVAGGGAGFENGVVVFESGGNSSGFGIYLIEGDFVFVVKMNGSGPNEPTVPLPDTDWTGNTIGVELLGSVPADEEVTLALVFDLDSVRYSVNGGAEVNVQLTNRGTKDNWQGDNSVNIGKWSANAGGIGQVSPTYWDEAFFDAGLTNNVTSLRWWNGSGSGFLFDDFEVVTVTLSIDGYTDDATSGTLSDTSGNGESYSAGTWSITGSLLNVNAALADVKYTFGTGGAPVTISISVEDGDEDGGGALAGAISIILGGSNAGPLYVDDDSFGGLLPGAAVTDADFSTGNGNQAATFGTDAFDNLADAVGAADPALAVEIIVNDGDYSGEAIDLFTDLPLATIRLADTPGGVSIGTLDTETTNSIDLQGNTLSVGSGTIKCGIAGTGGLTKNGSGDLVLHNVVTYTGTTTINDGILRVGADGGSLLSSLDGDGPVEVNAPGRFEINPLLDTQTINQTGAISGDGVVASMGDGTVIFDGTGNPGLTGTFELGDGTTSNWDGTVGNKQGFVVVNNSSDLGAGMIISKGSQLQAGTTGIVIAPDIDIEGGGLRCGGGNSFELSGIIVPVDAPRGISNFGPNDGTVLTLSGTLDMSGSGTPRDFAIDGGTGVDERTIEISADVVGDGTLTLQGTASAGFEGVCVLSGANTYTGTTSVLKGTLVLDGSHTGAVGTYTVSAGATLAGSGSTTAPVVVNSGGTLAAGASTGTLATGDLVIDGTLEVEIDETATPGNDYDQIVVTGTVDIDGADITLSSTSGNAVNFATGGLVTIIDNDDGADAVTGTFTGFAEGSSLGGDFLGSGRAASISYVGGPVFANDVVIDIATTLSPIGTWRAANFAGDPSNSGVGANTADSEGSPDGLDNLLEFGFGTDPVNSTYTGGLVWDGVNLTPGQPIAVEYFPGVDLQFVQRTDEGTSGSVRYVVEFSSDMTDWETSDDMPTPGWYAAPTVVGSDPAVPGYELVKITFPFTMVNGKKARFGRVTVIEVP